MKPDLTRTAIFTVAVLALFSTTAVASEKKGMTLENSTRITESGTTKGVIVSEEMTEI